MKYPKYSRNNDVSYCFGIYPVLKLLELKNKMIIEIFLSDRSKESDGVLKIIEIADSLNIPVNYNDIQIKRLTNNESVLAVGVFKKYESQLEKDKNHLILVNPSDMGNVGTIIRTADAFDVKNIGLISPATDIFDPKVIRASMGSVYNINFQYFDNIENYIEAYAKSRSCFMFMTNGEYNLNTIENRVPFTLIFGNEGAGLDYDYRKYGPTVKIPQSNDVDSLNLSISVGIALYKFCI